MTRRLVGQKKWEGPKIGKLVVWICPAIAGPALNSSIRQTRLFKRSVMSTSSIAANGQLSGGFLIHIDIICIHVEKDWDRFILIEMTHQPLSHFNIFSGFPIDFPMDFPIDSCDISRFPMDFHPGGPTCRSISSSMSSLRVSIRSLRTRICPSTSGASWDLIFWAEKWALK